MTAAGKQVAQQVAQQISEPNRKSMFDIIHDNFKLANRQIYVYRLFYIGKHTFPDSFGENICDFLHNIIKNINAKHCDERLTGFLLYYPTYFCHVIEGSEDTIQKHLRRVIQEPKFGTCKVLCVYHHINQRFVNSWTYITAKPATLVEKIDPNSSLKDTCAKIMYCLKKLYKLGNLLKRQEEALHRVTDELPNTEERGSSAMFLISEQTANQRASLTPTPSRPRPSVKPAETAEQVTPICLPEYTILDFLIETPFTQRLYDYCKAFGSLPKLDEYEDLVWPIASDGIPLDVFDKEFDPINNLPNVQGMDVDTNITDFVDTV